MSPNAVQTIISVELKQAKSPIVIALGVLGSAHFDIGRDILHCTSYTSRLYRAYHIIDVRRRAGLSPAAPLSSSLFYFSSFSLLSHVDYLSRRTSRLRINNLRLALSKASIELGIASPFA
jgi:hypothetical protein